MIQDDAHLLVVLHYIEANPLRAGTVADPGDYRWSSYPAHALGRPDPLLSPLPELESLGDMPAERQDRWRRGADPQGGDEILRVARNSGRASRWAARSGWERGSQDSG